MPNVHFTLRALLEASSSFYAAGIHLTDSGRRSQTAQRKTWAWTAPVAEEYLLRCHSRQRHQRYLDRNY